MYVQDLLAEKRPEVLSSFIRENAFGILVVVSPEGAEANHLPFELICDGSQALALRTHVSRSNPVWRRLDGEGHVLVIFQGAHCYISPAWHPSRKTHGKVAPSWNYSAVHVTGRASVIKEQGWLLEHLGGLVWQNENSREDSWSLDEAPADFVENSAKYIVGLEIDIDDVVGKFQASQQYAPDVRVAIAEGLRNEGHGKAGAARASAVAKMIEERGELLR